MDPYMVSRIGAVTIQRILPEASKQNANHNDVFQKPDMPTGDLAGNGMESEKFPPGNSVVSREEIMEQGDDFGEEEEEEEEEEDEEFDEEEPDFEPEPEAPMKIESEKSFEDVKMGENEAIENRLDLLQDNFNARSESSIDSRTSGGGSDSNDALKTNKADKIISSLTQSNFQNLDSVDISKKLGRFGFSVSVSEVKKPPFLPDVSSLQDETMNEEEDPSSVNKPADNNDIKSIETLVSSLSEQPDQFTELNPNVEVINELDFKKEIFSDGLDSETVDSEIGEKPSRITEEEEKMEVVNKEEEELGKEGAEEEMEDGKDEENEDDGGDEGDDDENGEKNVKRSKKTKQRESTKKEGDSSSSESDSDSEISKKRKSGVLNLRRNIREVMDETQLDESTLAAQRQEMERLRRVQEQQRIIREVQRQIAINRQQNKTQTRVISLLQGGSSSSKTTVTTASSSKPNTVVVKVSSGSGSTQIVNKKVLDLLKSQKSNSENAADVKLPAIPRTLNKPHMVTPSVSIAPVQVKSASSSTTPADDLSDEENVARAAAALKKKAAHKKDVVTISSSGSEDDCIVISEPSAGEESEPDDDPTNSGMHTNDAYNVPDEQGRVLINVGHPESEPDVFLSPQIARIIKPHQIGGVRFLFDNVVESLERYKTSNGFGCILAHSMGLGKTLQVISFCDVFLRYTEGRSVLCIMPINTLQNWVAEFNHWLPTDATNSPLAADGEVKAREFPLFILNDFHKSINARSKVITEWKKEGGVLLIGYELYRQLSLKKPRKTRSKKKEEEVVDDDKHKPLLEEMYEALVKPGPDLVICDEGHRIKNSHASISHALKQIRSKRRVVLTGYPLQNNLLEYWCMVDFVRPNYLGSKTEFSNMFERPIQNGQCVDSTPQDVRLMRYRAHVLHSLLEGFVQRRSHSVLQQALPQKEEYVLLVRMTPFQRKLYETFMNEVVRIKAVPNPLKAFAVCCKIWNHPDILYNFLKKKEEVDLDLVEAAACLGAPGSVAPSTPATPATPATPTPTKGAKRGRGKDPSSTPAKKEKKPRKNSRGANQAADKTPAVATVMPNASNNSSSNEQTLPPFNYPNNSNPPNNQNNMYNANPNFPNDGRFPDYNQQQFPNQMGPNYNATSQQPYNSFNYDQTNYPAPQAQPQDQQQGFYPPGYPDQGNYWQDNSSLYPNNPDPNAGMGYFANNSNGFYEQNNSDFNAPNNMYNQPNYSAGCYDNNSAVSGPENNSTMTPLLNVGNNLRDSTSNLDTFNNKDSTNFDCLPNTASVSNYDDVSDNVHSLVNSSLNLGSMTDDINQVDNNLLNSASNLAPPSNCEVNKDPTNFHNLQCSNFSDNNIYQNLGTSQFLSNPNRTDMVPGNIQNNNHQNVGTSQFVPNTNRPDMASGNIPSVNPQNMGTSQFVAGTNRTDLTSGNIPSTNPSTPFAPSSGRPDMNPGNIPNPNHQNMAASQFIPNASRTDLTSGNISSTNMMGSMLNDTAVNTVNNNASNSNVIPDSFNSIPPYPNQQFPNEMYPKDGSYPQNSENFPPHQMNMPFNQLTEGQSDFGPPSKQDDGFSPVKKEMDSNLYQNPDSSMGNLNYPFKSESKDDVKNLPATYPQPSSNEPKKEEKGDFKPDVKPKDEESSTGDSKKDDAKQETATTGDGSKGESTVGTKPTFENPASKKEDPGIPYDWAMKLLEDYIPGEIDASPKMAIFFCIVEESVARGDRILVFSQSLFTLNLIEDFLQKNYIPGTQTYWAKNWSYYRLDGSTTASEREKLINEFNSNDQVHMFLVSTRAGSLGINLVGANRVIVFDASWNPCHDTQAVCRVYRYGQQKPCFVYRLVMDNCLEKKIYDRQINKQGMADRVVDECNPDAHLSIKEVANLCWDNDEDSAPQDHSDKKDKYTDIIIHKILDNFSHFLSKAPFEHESLLVDRKDKKLSTAEKRLAKRSYELEKQANTRPTYNFIGNQQGLQIRSMNKPMASVRPMQSEMNSQLNKDSNSKWIPAEVWQKQGMSAQEMTLPLDVVIPTNSADRSSIVLNAGQKVMVLKSPKGIYMQLENGKIIAIRTAYKVGAGANKGGEKKVFSTQPQSRQVPLNRPPFDRNVRSLEGRREISVSPIRGRSQAVPGLLRNNSSISITPRTVPVSRNVSPGAKPNGSLMRLLGPKSRTTNVRLPVIKDSNVSVTITKRNPTTSSATSSTSSFAAQASSEHFERDSNYQNRNESRTQINENFAKGSNFDSGDSLSQSPSSSSSSFNHPIEKTDVKSVGTDVNASEFKDSLGSGTPSASTTPTDIYNEPIRPKIDMKTSEFKQSDKMYHEPPRPKIDIKTPEFKQMDKMYSEPVRPKIDIKTPEYKQINKFNDPMRPKMDMKPVDKAYSDPMKGKLDKSPEYKQMDKMFNDPMRPKMDMKTSEYKPLDKMKNLMYSRNQNVFPQTAVSDRTQPQMTQPVDKSKFGPLPSIPFGSGTSQKNYRPTSHQRPSMAMSGSYHNDTGRMSDLPMETSPTMDFKKPTASNYNQPTFSSTSDMPQVSQQFKNSSNYQSSDKGQLTKEAAFQNLKSRGSISIIPMDKPAKSQPQPSQSQSRMPAPNPNPASQIPAAPAEYDYRSNIEPSVEPFTSPAYRSDYYSNFNQPISSAPSPSSQIHPAYSNPNERSNVPVPAPYDMYQQSYPAGPSVGSSNYNNPHPPPPAYSPSYESPDMSQQMYSAFHRPEPAYPPNPAPSYQNQSNPYQYNTYYPPYGANSGPDSSSLQNPQRPL